MDLSLDTPTPGILSFPLGVSLVGIRRLLPDFSTVRKVLPNLSISPQATGRPGVVSPDVNRVWTKDETKEAKVGVEESVRWWTTKDCSGLKAFRSVREARGDGEKPRSNRTYPRRVPYCLKNKNSTTVSKDVTTG